MATKQWQSWLIANPTMAESRLLSSLSAHPLLCSKFQFQAIVHGFIPDFWFPSYNLVVEVDGSVHNSVEARKKDALRTSILESKGIKVLRFNNNSVFKNLNNVIFKISCYCRIKTDKKKRPFRVLDYVNELAFPIGSKVRRRVQKLRRKSGI